MEKITTQTPEKLHDENYWLMILAYFFRFFNRLGNYRFGCRQLGANSKQCKTRRRNSFDDSQRFCGDTIYEIQKKHTDSSAVRSVRRFDYGGNRADWANIPTAFRCQRSLPVVGAMRLAAVFDNAASALALDTFAFCRNKIFCYL